MELIEVAHLRRYLDAADLIHALTGVATDFRPFGAAWPHYFY
jgi:hypothetical protein